MSRDLAGLDQQNLSAVPPSSNRWCRFDRTDRACAVPGHVRLGQTVQERMGIPVRGWRVHVSSSRSAPRISDDHRAAPGGVGAPTTVTGPTTPGHAVQAHRVDQHAGERTAPLHCPPAGRLPWTCRSGPGRVPVPRATASRASGGRPGRSRRTVVPCNPVEPNRFRCHAHRLGPARRGPAPAPFGTQSRAGGRGGAGGPVQRRDRVRSRPGLPPRDLVRPGWPSPSPNCSAGPFPVPGTRRSRRGR